MRARIATVAGLLVFGASSAFAGSVNFNFDFAGPDMTLGTSQNYTSNGATITAFGYECSAPTPMSTSTLSDCALSDLYQSPTGLGLAGEMDHDIGWDSATADYVVGLDLSDLLTLGTHWVTMTYNTILPGQAWVAIGYSSDPFTAGSPFLLGANTKAWSEVDSATFDLNAQDQYLVLIASCGASSNPYGPCGSDVTPVSLTASATTPEPGTMLLFATGLLALAFISRRRWAAV
ncbi:MAG: PEP-CTERM sorting domain-containing protein [Candidatus Acidiferrales bacterium]